MVFNIINFIFKIIIVIILNFKFPILTTLIYFSNFFIQICINLFNLNAVILDQPFFIHIIIIKLFKKLLFILIFPAYLIYFIIQLKYFKIMKKVIMKNIHIFKKVKIILIVKIGNFFFYNSLYFPFKKNYLPLLPLKLYYYRYLHLFVRFIYYLVRKRNHQF